MHALSGLSMNLRFGSIWRNTEFGIGLEEVAASPLEAAAGRARCLRPALVGVSLRRRLVLQPAAGDTVPNCVAAFHHPRTAPRSPTGLLSCRAATLSRITWGIDRGVSSWRRPPAHPKGRCNVGCLRCPALRQVTLGSPAGPGFLFVIWRCSLRVATIAVPYNNHKNPGPVLVPGAFFWLLAAKSPHHGVRCDLRPRRVGRRSADVKRYGDDAMLEAAGRANRLLDEGDITGAETWHRILNAIERLQAKAPTEGEKVH